MLEDEEHLLWWCEAWATAWEPFIADVMLLAKAVRDWPPCLRSCAIVPESMVKAKGMDQDSRRRKRCQELYRIPRRWLFLPDDELEPKRQELFRLAEAGRKWAAGDQHPWEIFMQCLHGMFLAVLRAKKMRDDESGLLFPVQTSNGKRDTYPWHHLQLPQLRESPTDRHPGHQTAAKGMEMGAWSAAHSVYWQSRLIWLKLPPMHECLPWAHRQASFMELSLDFEAYARRSLPPAPQCKFTGGDMPLQEKGRVLRLIATLLGRAMEQESIFPAKMTHHCRSLTSMGAGTVMGLEAPRLQPATGSVAPPRAAAKVWGGQVSAKQKACTAKRKAKAQGKTQKPARDPPTRRGDSEKKRCPAKGGAKSSARRYATDFYAKPEKVQPGLHGGGRGCWIHGAGATSCPSFHTADGTGWGPEEGN